MSGNDEEDAADLSSGLVANLMSLAKKKTSQSYFILTTLDTPWIT